MDINKLDGENAQITNIVSKTAHIRFSGIPVIQCIHIILQVICIPFALNRMQHLYQIIIPLPSGIFVLVSVCLNVIIFGIRLLDTSPAIQLLTSSFTQNTSGQNLIELKLGRIRHKQPQIFVNTEGIQEFDTIHNNGSWILLYILGIGWNIYLFNKGIILLGVSAHNQGDLFSIYAFISIFGYALMFFFPEKRITAYNTENQPIYLIIPPLLISIGRKIELHYGREFVNQFQRMLKYQPPKSPSRISKREYFSGPYIPYLILWTTLVFASNSFLGNLYLSQFIEPIIVVWWWFEIRNVSYNNELNENLQLSRTESTKPFWYYCGWLFIWYESGFKAWYVLTFFYHSSIDVGGLLVFSWVCYLLLSVMLIREIKQIHFWTKNGLKGKIMIFGIIAILIFMQSSVILSVLRIWPFYLSILEFGPIL